MLKRKRIVFVLTSFTIFIVLLMLSENDNLKFDSEEVTTVTEEYDLEELIR